jgi:hypothetical protein
VLGLFVDSLGFQDGLFTSQVSRSAINLY